MTDKPKLNARSRALVPLLSRELVSRFAAIALVNAQSLFHDALALHTRGSYGTARSLAISAREECGKVNLAGLCLVGGISPEEFVSQLRNHNPKQAEGLVSPWFAAALQSKEFDHLVSIDINHDLPNILTQLAASFSGRPLEWKQAILPTLPTLRAERDAASAGAHESARQAGIYVSLEVENGVADILHPFAVTKEQCEEELSRLAFVMDPTIPFSIPEQMEPGATGTTVEEIARQLDQAFTPELLRLLTIADPTAAPDSGIATDQQKGQLYTRPGRCTGDARTRIQREQPMASGPDPNRFDPADPEMESERYRDGDSLGDLRSTRLGLPTWGVAVLLIAVFVLFLVLTR